MARPKKDKILISAKIDTDLKPILDRLNVDRSALINSLLWRYIALRNDGLSQNSRLKTPIPKCSVADLNCGPFDYQSKEIWGKSIETREKTGFELGFVYTLHQKKIELYLFEKYSQTYSKEMYSTLNKIFIEKKSKGIEDIKQLLINKEVNDRAGRTAFRVFLNYCEENETLDDESIIKYRRKIKLNISTNIDTFVPTKNKINQSLSQMKKVYPEFIIFYKLILESGCRPSELKEMLINFDKSKIEEWDDKIIVYRNMYLRKSKNSFYLFFTKKTFDEFLMVDRTNISTLFNSFKERVVRDKDIINLKYLRKYHFTLMIERGISFEIANWIQGRANQKDVGFNSYLAKKTIAVREYQKILLKL